MENGNKWSAGGTNGPEAKRDRSLRTYPMPLFLKISGTKSDIEIQSIRKTRRCDMLLEMGMKITTPQFQAAGSSAIEHSSAVQTLTNRKTIKVRYLDALRTEEEVSKVFGLKVDGKGGHMKILTNSNSR